MCQCSCFLLTFWIHWIPEMKLEMTRSRLWSQPVISFQKYNCDPSREIYSHFCPISSIVGFFPVTHSPSALCRLVLQVKATVWGDSHCENWPWTAHCFTRDECCHLTPVVDWLLSPQLPYYMILSQSARGCLGWNLAVKGWEHSEECVFYKIVWSWAGSQYYSRL